MSETASPKITVIMPVYNTEKYVEEALKTIVNQTFRDIEIIVINDGSTDKSLQIIEQIAQSDSRIQIYSQSNQGLSRSRNTGMQKILGKYVYFMDSDDLLDRDALERCYEKCEKDNLDFAFFDAEVFCCEDPSLFNDYYIRKNNLDKALVYNGTQLLNQLMDINLYRPSVWLCFIKWDFLRDLNLDFYPGIIHEDELFSAILYTNANKIGYLPYPYFKRRVRKDSITSSNFSMRNIECYLIVISELQRYAEGEGKPHKSTLNRICSYIINPAIYRAANFSADKRFEVFKLCAQHNCLKYISLKNIAILFFPFLIKAKANINKKIN